MAESHTHAHLPARLRASYDALHDMTTLGQMHPFRQQHEHVLKAAHGPALAVLLLELFAANNTWI